jgi:PPOX class probable F420-dependent enzyme
MSIEIPADYAHLLTEPNYGHLGTVRPDDTVQVNPMWFEFDGEVLRFTHTTKRAKFRNLQHNPSMSLSVMDPADPFRYLEAGEFYVRLGRRYGNPDQAAPADSPDRVILIMSVEKTTKQ